MSLRNIVLSTAILASSAIVFSQNNSLQNTTKNIVSKTINYPLNTTNKKLITIMLDAGHSSNHPGNQYNDLKEEEIVLNVVKQIKKPVEKTGVKVYLTRTDSSALHTNYKKDMQARIQKRQELNPDYFATIHINTFDSPKIKGMEIYYFGVNNKKYLNNEQKDFFKPEHTYKYESTPSKELALALQQYIFEQTGEKPRVRGSDLAILKRDLNNREELNEKNIYIELGYITNPEDMKKIKENPEQYSQLISGFFTKITSK